MQILVPELGDIEQVEVIEVAAQPGTLVNPGDLLVVLESDKASMEIPLEVSGKLLEISVAVGDQVSAGSLLAVAEVDTPYQSASETLAQPQASAGGELCWRSRIAAGLVYQPASAIRRRCCHLRRPRDSSIGEGNRGPT